MYIKRKVICIHSAINKFSINRPGDLKHGWS